MGLTYTGVTWESWKQHTRELFISTGIMQAQSKEAVLLPQDSFVTNSHKAFLWWQEISLSNLQLGIKKKAWRKDLTLI